jgi:alkanesulfonate monooxygenase SsuD/methylene tetrahydromethanopterin reductase-like flavin-dependent oxidoreductase (luciferase family)
MQIGITIFATDLSMDPVELAVEVEARGFHSLYVPEHTHIPTSRRTAGTRRRWRATASTPSGGARTCAR